jgi:hypothetical protein
METQIITLMHQKQQTRADTDADKIEQNRSTRTNWAEIEGFRRLLTQPPFGPQDIHYHRLSKSILCPLTYNATAELVPSNFHQRNLCNWASTPLDFHSKSNVVTTFVCFNSKTARQTGEKHSKGANIIIDHFLSTAKTTEVSMTLHLFITGPKRTQNPNSPFHKVKPKGSSKHPCQINRLTIDLSPKTAAIG